MGIEKNLQCIVRCQEFAVAGLPDSDGFLDVVAGNPSRSAGWNDSEPAVDIFPAVTPGAVFFLFDGEATLKKLFVLLACDAPPRHQFCDGEKLLVGRLEAPGIDELNRIARTDPMMATDLLAIDVSCTPN